MTPADQQDHQCEGEGGHGAAGVGQDVRGDGAGQQAAEDVPKGGALPQEPVGLRGRRQVLLQRLEHHAMEKDQRGGIVFFSFFFFFFFFFFFGRFF